MDFLEAPRSQVLPTAYQQISTAHLHQSSKTLQQWHLAASSSQDDSWTSASNKSSPEQTMRSGIQVVPK
jgi:hypothetical protein